MKWVRCLVLFYLKKRCHRLFRCQTLHGSTEQLCSPGWKVPAGGEVNLLGKMMEDMIARFMVRRWYLMQDA
jgi:hypothetical protein